MNKSGFLFWLVLTAVVANLTYLNFRLLSSKNSVTTSSSVSPSPTILPEKQPLEEAEIMAMVESRIASAVATIAAVKPAAQNTSLPKTETKSAVNTYLPLGNGSSTMSQNWTTIAGSEFILDLKDYPTNTQFFWEGNLKTDSINSRCYARIYDIDNLRAVDYSEQSSNSVNYEFLKSQPLRIWAGKNHYRLEIKSLNGLSCYLASPRLLIKSN